VRQGNGPADGAAFDLVLRGYDRRQVDERLAQLQAHIATTEKALREEQRRCTELSGQLHGALSRLRQAGGGGQQNSFGFRVEKILRLAEQEASELRSHAAAEAAALVKRARAEAERLRATSERELVRLTALRDQVVVHLDEVRKLVRSVAPADPPATGPDGG